MNAREAHQHPVGPTPVHRALEAAVARRRPILDQRRAGATRVCSAEADGVPGVFVDVYGPAAVLIIHEGREPGGFDPASAASTLLELLKPWAVESVYVKRFAKDRSRLGGNLPDESRSPTPAAGKSQPESILIREFDWLLEIRLYDGLSTGLFLDQRENRRFVAEWCASRRGDRGASAPAVLNTFAYTCAFSVAAAMSGAVTTSVDVSARYLEWGKRNFAHNNVDPALHRFAKMDTFEFFNYARRKKLMYDLIILDPPSFASGSKKTGAKPWSSVADYSRLVSEAAGLLSPRGLILASTNTQELCRPGRFDREIARGLGKTPKWVSLPNAPADFAGEDGRFVARAFTL